MNNQREPDNRVSHQPAFVLHTYPWKETSLIVEVLTRDYGRLSLVAKGAKRPMSQYRGMLCPFCPLAVSFSGKGDVKTLTKCEWHGTLMLPDTVLMSAFYMNEILVRLLPKREPVPKLFHSYFTTLRNLADKNKPHVSLRIFELDLLETLGYGVPEPREGTNYQFVRGDWIQSAQTPESTGVAWGTLAAMRERRIQEGAQEKEVKGIIRDVISFYLDDKPVNTRKILSELKKF